VIRKSPAHLRVPARVGGSILRHRSEYRKPGSDVVFANGWHRATYGARFLQWTRALGGTVVLMP